MDILITSEHAKRLLPIKKLHKTFAQNRARMTIPLKFRKLRPAVLTIPQVKCYIEKANNGNTKWIGDEDSAKDFSSEKGSFSQAYFVYVKKK